MHRVQLLGKHKQQHYSRCGHIHLLAAFPLRTAFTQTQAIDRRERLRRLALETIDLAKDPYFMRNHLGQYECRLCLTLHNNEGNYLAHTQVQDFLIFQQKP